MSEQAIEMPLVYLTSDGLRDALKLSCTGALAMVRSRHPEVQPAAWRQKLNGTLLPLWLPEQVDLLRELEAKRKAEGALLASTS